MWYAGIDWADDHHAQQVKNEEFTPQRGIGLPPMAVGCEYDGIFERGRKIGSRHMVQPHLVGRLRHAGSEQFRP